MAIRWNMLLEALIIVVAGGLIIEAIDLIFKWVVKKVRSSK